MTDRELLEDMYGKMQSMEDKIQGMNDKLELTNQKVTAMQLSLENETNHNIQLLAENHINLVDKLN